MCRGQPLRATRKGADLFCGGLRLGGAVGFQRLRNCAKPRAKRPNKSLGVGVEAVGEGEGCHTYLPTLRRQRVEGARQLTRALALIHRRACRAAAMPAQGEVREAAVGLALCRGVPDGAGEAVAPDATAETDGARAPVGTAGAVLAG